MWFLDFEALWPGNIQGFVKKSIHWTTTWPRIDDQPHISVRSTYDLESHRYTKAPSLFTIKFCLFWLFSYVTTEIYTDKWLSYMPKARATYFNGVCSVYSTLGRSVTKHLCGSTVIHGLDQKAVLLQVFGHVKSLQGWEELFLSLWTCLLGVQKDVAPPSWNLLWHTNSLKTADTIEELSWFWEWDCTRYIVQVSSYF